MVMVTVQRVDWFHDGTSYNINDKIVLQKSKRWFTNPVT